jgi:hypothetical protein
MSRTIRRRGKDNADQFFTDRCDYHYNWDDHQDTKVYPHDFQSKEHHDAKRNFHADWGYGTQHVYSKFYIEQYDHIRLRMDAKNELSKYYKDNDYEVIIRHKAKIPYD